MSHWTEWEYDTMTINTGRRNRQSLSVEFSRAACSVHGLWVWTMTPLRPCDFISRGGWSESFFMVSILIAKQDDLAGFLSFQKGTRGAVSSEPI